MVNSPELNKTPTYLDPATNPTYYQQKAYEKNIFLFATVTVLYFCSSIKSI